MGWKKVCFDLKQGQDFFPIWPWEGCPGHFHIKVMGMLVVSLWDVNYRFWSHLGCLGWKVTIFTHSGITKKFTKNALTLTTQKSPLEVNLSLSHTHIGLPQGFKLNFPMSIPVTFIWEYPRRSLDNSRAHPLQEFLGVSPPPPRIRRAIAFAPNHLVILIQATYHPSLLIASNINFT